MIYSTLYSRVGPKQRFLGDLNQFSSASHFLSVPQQKMSECQTKAGNQECFEKLILSHSFSLSHSFNHS